MGSDEATVAARHTQHPTRAAMFRALLCVVVAATFGLTGCSKPEPWEREEPEEALKVFLAALNYRQTELAWEFLLPDDRAVLESRAAALEALGGPARDPAAFLSVGHVISSPSEYASIEATGTDGERTAMKITLHDERELSLDMVRRDGRWYVDLPLETIAAAAPTPDPTDDPTSSPQEPRDE